MSSLLRISEAASLAMHTMVLLAAGREQRWSVRRMAEALGASSAHLSKVLQRLAHEGLVTSERGPKGGYALAAPPENITLLQVYEAIEGPLSSSNCILGADKCLFRKCIMGNLIAHLNQKVKAQLANRTLAQLRHLYRRPR